MRNTEPWRLPEEMLRAGKVFTDPVHGDVYLTKLEMLVVDSGPFQRLRTVRQLGTTLLVYPGATHTRFAHSLGALQAVQDLLDGAVDQSQGPRPVPDLIAQWRADGTLEKDLAKATVLARLGALLHDICHVPFGHSIEDEMGILKAHDDNRDRLDWAWKGFGAELRKWLKRGGLWKQLEPIIAPDLIADERNLTNKEELIDDLPFPFVSDLVGNTICADLIDYLSRDHLYTGLPMALGRRFLSSFFITPDGEQKYNRRRMVLSVAQQERNGSAVGQTQTAAPRERTDTVSELLKYLRYRYELTERVLTHHAKLRADAMIGKMLLLWRDYLVTEEGGDPDEAFEKDAPAKQRDAATAAVSAIEAEMLRHGDDGLLEHMAELGRAGETKDPGRMGPVTQLAEGIQSRNLFEPAGRCSATRAPAKKLWDEYKEPPARLRLEREIAHYAGIPAWKLAIWLPPRNMGLKVARVLVYDGASVMPFVDYEEQGRRRGEEISDAHRDLWAISLFVDESVDKDNREVIRVKLAQLYEIVWEEMNEDYASPNTEDWPDELAARRVARARGRRGKAYEKLMKKAEPVQARGGDPDSQTFAATQAYFESIADSVWKAKT
jgi:HD superfamily phosphohydrolase